MATEMRPATVAVATLMLLVVILGAVLVVENRRMKAVLIEQTLLQLERDYEEARRVETANLAVLKSSLEDAFQGLTAIRALSVEEAALVHRAISLTNAILESATSEGITVEW